MARLSVVFVPVPQVLFGSDYPMLPLANAAEGLARLRLSAAAVEAIEHGNARALFPRLRAAADAS